MRTLTASETNPYDVLPDQIREAIGRPDVTDVEVVDGGTAYIEGFGKLVKLPDMGAHVPVFLKLAAACAGELINVENPSLECTLPGGERLNGSCPPVGDWTYSLRRPMGRRLSLEDWIELGTATERHAEIVVSMVRKGLNIFISGAMGSGKTTFLNTLLGLPELAGKRAAFIEKEAELLPTGRSTSVQVKHIGWELAQAKALRSNAEIVCIGEARAAGDMAQVFTVMSSGHRSFTTLHARSAEHTAWRIETLMRQSGDARPVREIRADIMDLGAGVVHLEKREGGNRKITNLGMFWMKKNGQVGVKQI